MQLSPRPSRAGKTGAARRQNVTGPRLSAPKQDPPPGAVDAPGRSLPFLRPPRTHSFFGRLTSPPSPAAPTQQTHQMLCLPPAGNTDAHSSARNGISSPYPGPADGWIWGPRASTRPSHLEMIATTPPSPQLDHLPRHPCSVLDHQIPYSTFKTEGPSPLRKAKAPGLCCPSQEYSAQWGPEASRRDNPACTHLSSSWSCSALNLPSSICSLARSRAVSSRARRASASSVS